MASTLTRRPLPALVSLLALLLLTGLVWWRVLHRDDAGGAAEICPTPTTAAAATTLPTPDKVTVQVLNATSRSGIASKARSTLVTAGFQSPQPAANDRSNVRVRGVADIRYGPTGTKGAKLLQLYFPGARLVPTATAKTATVVVSLGDTYKRVASPSAVQAALRAQHLTLETPAPEPTGTASC